MASKCFFSFCSFSISEIKSEVGKQLQLQAGGGEGIDFMANYAFGDRNQTKNLKGW